MIAKAFPKKITGGRLLAGTVFVFLACGNLFALETLTITDSACAGCTVALAPVANGNNLLFAGAVGAWSVSVTAQDLGDPSDPDLDLAVLGSTPSSPSVNDPGVLSVTFTETGYAGTPPLILDMGVGGIDRGAQTSTNVTIAGVAQPIISYDGAAGSSNGTQVVPYEYSVSNVAITPATQPYGITIQTVTTPAIGNFPRAGSSDYQLEGSLAPEPGFYGLTGLGLAGLLAVGAVRRRNRQEKSQATA